MTDFMLNVIKLTYVRFGYFLMFLLVAGAMINGTSEITTWIALSISIPLVIAELFIMVYVEFTDEEETFLRRFLRRFTRADVLLAMILIVVYIGGCNGWMAVS